MRVLLVDDEPNFLEQTKVFLEKEEEGLEVETAPSADEALSLLDEDAYDAVVSDYQMPETDGLEFLKIVREERESDIPFIIFTGKSREEVAIEALNLGSNRYLRKGGDLRSQYRVLAQSIVQEVEHSRTKREKEKARKEWRTTFDALPDIAALISLDHEFIRVNEKVAETLNMDRENLIGKKCYEVVHGLDKPIEDCPCTQVLETEEPDSGEVFEEKGRYYIASASPILDDNGEVEAFAHTIKDITERRKAVEERERERERYEELFKGANEMIITTNEEGYVKRTNRRVEETSGYSEEELKGETILKIAHPDDTDKYIEFWQEILDGEEPHYELRSLTADGETIYLLARGRAIVEDGEVVEIQYNAQDITDRKKMEEALKQRERRFRSIVENSHEGILVTNESYELIYANDKLCEMAGYSRDEIIGNDFREFLDDKSRELVADRYRRRQKGEEVPPRYEFNIVRKNGERKRVEISSTVVETAEGGKRTIAQLLDISGEKEAEQRLKKTKERYEELFKGANELVVTTDREGYIKRVNRKTVEVSGYSEEELVGESVLKIAHPDDRNKYIEFWQEILDKKEEVSKTLRSMSKKGEVGWLKAGGVPIFEDDEIVEIQYTAQEITERVKSQEREKFLHSLLRHDVQNNTQVAQGYLDLLREADLPEEYEKYLEKAEIATEKSFDLIEKVRTLSKMEDEEVEEIDLEPLIQGAVENCKSATSEMDFQIEMECPVEGCKVEAGPLLEDLFSNLLENSVRHSEGSQIKITNESTNEEMICIVEDDGRGIPDEIKEKIFEKGYKKGENAGSGLGLYLVKEITESYGGSVKVKDSELGGARFEVCLQKV